MPFPAQRLFWGFVRTFLNLARLFLSVVKIFRTKAWIRFSLFLILHTIVFSFLMLRKIDSLSRLVQALVDIEKEALTKPNLL